MTTEHAQPMTLLDLAALSPRNGLGASVGDDATDTISGIVSDAEQIVDDGRALSAAEDAPEFVAFGVAEDAPKTVADDAPSVGDDGIDVA